MMPRIASAVSLGIAFLTASPALAVITGRVVYVTAGQAHLSRGSDVGLEAGQTVDLYRRKRRVTSCQVESVSPSFSVCRGKDVRIDDVFGLEDPKEESEKDAKDLPAPWTEQERKVLLAKVQSSEVPRVSFEGTRSERKEWTASAQFEHQFWAQLSSGGASQREQLSFNVAGAPVALGFRAYGQGSAMVWSQNPSTDRFRPSQDAQLYLWQAELNRRRDNNQLMVSLGRVFPWHVPGLATLDGAQLGWRDEDRSWEVGVFGGGLPMEVSTNPSFQRWAAGAYHHQRVSSGKLALSLESRLSYIDLNSSQRVSAENVTRVAYGPHFQLSGGARGQVDLTTDADLSLQAWYVSLSSRLSSSMSVYGGARQMRGVAPFASADQFAGTWGRSTFANLGVSWLVTTWLEARAQGFYTYDDPTELSRYTANGSLRFPRLLRIGDLEAGYSYYGGKVPGWQAYLMGTLGSPRWNALARVAYTSDGPQNEQRAVLAYLSGRVSITRWLALSAGFLGNFDAAGVSSSGPGLRGQVAVEGTL